MGRPTTSKTAGSNRRPAAGICERPSPTTSGSPNPQAQHSIPTHAELCSHLVQPPLRQPLSRMYKQKCAFTTWDGALVMRKALQVRRGRAGLQGGRVSKATRTGGGWQG